MTSRRKFLIQGSLATTALLVAKPFKTFAGSAFSSTNLSSTNLVFLHTSNLDAGSESKVISMLAEMKNNNQNTILLKAVKDSSKNSSLQYDASFQSGDISFDGNKYKIIRKGSLRIGIIAASTGDNNVIGEVNSLASRLKMLKGCDVVVCLSHLGYKNANHIDDITLAAKSKSIDIIIGGHSSNVSKHTMIAMNSKNTEVIIESSARTAKGFSSVHLDFNNKGHKQSISFNNHKSSMVNIA